MEEIQKLLQSTTPKIITHKKILKPYNTSLTHTNIFAPITLWKLFLPQQTITVAARESLFEKHTLACLKDFWSTNVLSDYALPNKCQLSTLAKWLGESEHRREANAAVRAKHWDQTTRLPSHDSSDLLSVPASALVPLSVTPASTTYLKRGKWN